MACVTTPQKKLEAEYTQRCQSDPFTWHESQRRSLSSQLGDWAMLAIFDTTKQSWEEEIFSENNNDEDDLGLGLISLVCRFFLDISGRSHAMNTLLLLEKYISSPWTQWTNISKMFMSWHNLAAASKKMKMMRMISGSASSPWCVAFSSISLGDFTQWTHCCCWKNTSATPGHSELMLETMFKMLLLRKL